MPCDDDQSETQGHQYFPHHLLHASSSLDCGRVAALAIYSDGQNGLLNTLLHGPTFGLLPAYGLARHHVDHTSLPHSPCGIWQAVKSHGDLVGRPASRSCVALLRQRTLKVNHSVATLPLCHLGIFGQRGGACPCQ